MKISYIINSSANDPWLNNGSNPYRNAKYSQRRSLLIDKVLPAAVEQGFDEIIVAGVFEEGPGYEYVPVKPRHRDRRDALVQREIGARHATGDILVFGHDDHIVADDFFKMLWSYFTPPDDPHHYWDLLIPKRIHGITGAELNSGRISGYMGGHVLVMKRWLWAEVPWTTVDTEWWDTSLTRIWKEAGGKLVYANDLIHIDIEALEHEQ